MSASKRWGMLSGMMLLAAVLLGVTWWIVCMALGVGMLINGPYLIALLCALFGVAFAWASVRAERLERISARAKHIAYQRAVQHSAVSINEARAAMGIVSRGVRDEQAN